jgi:hypothetical protein
VAWDEAHGGLVDIVKGTTPTAKKLGMPPAFKHIPDGIQTQALPDSRAFWIDGLAGEFAGKEGNVVVLPMWFEANCALVRFYRIAKNLTELQSVIHGDTIALLKRLRDDSTWARATSTIESIFLGDGRLGRTAPATVEVEGAVVGLLVSTAISLQFRET